MDIHHILPAAAFAPAVAGAAQADAPRPAEARPTETRPTQAQPVAFGAVSGIAYATAERDGLRVVATVAADDARGEAGTPLRVEAVLAPCRPSPTSLPSATPFGVAALLGRIASRWIACGDGQSIVLSTPREAGAAPDTVTLVRQGDRVLVRGAAATN